MRGCACKGTHINGSGRGCSRARPPFAQLPASTFAGAGGCATTFLASSCHARRYVNTVQLSSSLPDGRAPSNDIMARLERMHPTLGLQEEDLGQLGVAPV